MNIHKTAMKGAESNLRRDGFVVPIFFGVTDEGTTYASPCGGYDNQEQKEVAFVSRIAALRSRGASQFTLVTEVYYSAYKEIPTDYLPPSQDPTAREGVLVQSSNGRASILSFGKEDDGSIRIDGWEDARSVAEGWILDAMHTVADMDVTDEGRSLSATMEAILDIDVYRLQDFAGEEE